MKLNLLLPAKSLNKAYLRQSLKREQIELFKSNLARLFDRVNEKESEENLNNIASEFLKYHSPSHPPSTPGKPPLSSMFRKFLPIPTFLMSRLRRKSTGWCMTCMG